MLASDLGCSLSSVLRYPSGWARWELSFYPGSARRVSQSLGAIFCALAGLVTPLPHLAAKANQLQSKQTSNSRSKTRWRQQHSWRPRERSGGCTVCVQPGDERATFKLNQWTLPTHSLSTSTFNPTYRPRLSQDFSYRCCRHASCWRKLPRKWGLLQHSTVQEFVHSVRVLVPHDKPKLLHVRLLFHWRLLCPIFAREERRQGIHCGKGQTFGDRESRGGQKHQLYLQMQLDTNRNIVRTRPSLRSSPRALGRQ